MAEENEALAPFRATPKHQAKVYTNRYVYIYIYMHTYPCTYIYIYINDIVLPYDEPHIGEIY